MNQTENPDLTAHIKKATAALGLTKKIVGVKLLPTAEDYAAFPAPPAGHRLSYCMMVRMAAYGKTLKAEDRHFKCNGARRALGLLPLDEHFVSGRHYQGMGLYGSRDNAREVSGNMAFLKRPLHSVAVYPLEDSPAEADVVLMICSVYQAMRIVQGYAYRFGFPSPIQMIGNQGVCAELTAQPLITGKINASVLCSGTRFACKWKDGEMGVGLPFGLFSRVVDGVLSTLDPTEPDPRKKEILERMNQEGVQTPITLGKNYYGSEPGAQKLKD